MDLHLDLHDIQGHVINSKISMAIHLDIFDIQYSNGYRTVDTNEFHGYPYKYPKDLRLRSPDDYHGFLFRDYPGFLSRDYCSVITDPVFLSSDW